MKKTFLTGALSACTLSLAIFTGAGHAASLNGLTEVDWEGAAAGNLNLLDDSNTGLQWLDLSLTGGTVSNSVLDVYNMTTTEYEAAIGAQSGYGTAAFIPPTITSGTYTGWRLATEDEVQALYDTAGAGTVSNSTNFVGADFLLRAMGGTVPTTTGGFLDPEDANISVGYSGPYQAEGYFYNFNDNGNTNPGYSLDDILQACLVASYTSTTTGSGYGFIHDLSNGRTVVNLDSKIGTYLVRDTTVVPVPAAVWLFGSGLLGLVGIARRKTA
jgi:hypothetical protein